jgi:hypothetical protein
MVRAVDESGNQEAVEIAEAIVVEVAEARRRSVLRPLWGKLCEIVPLAAAAVTVGSALHNLLA